MGPKTRVIFCPNSPVSILIVTFIAIQLSTFSTFAQSIGYHQNLNFGFNPFLSPVFGYGLGFPYGAYNFSPSRNPLLAYPLSGACCGNSLAGKLHTKTIMKKLALNPIAGSPYYGNLKNKIFLLKHPEYAYNPDGLDYGFGKHYGAAMIPNNPYKSTYADYYNANESSASKSTNLLPQSSQPYTDNHLHLTSNGAEYAISKTFNIIKPLVKAGVLMTTAALLSKKAFDVPTRLNPTGMILNSGGHIHA